MIPSLSITLFAGILLGIFGVKMNDYYVPFNPFKEHNRNVARYKNEQAKSDRLFLNYLIKLK